MKKNQKLYHRSSFRQISMLVIMIFGLFLTGSFAHANYFDDFYNGVEKFSDLPGQVNQLKQNYQETLDELERTKQSAKAFEEQNAQLVEQNRQLAETVDQLKEVNELKDAKTHKFKIMLITVILLVVGYFVIIRVIRFAMRQSNRRNRL
ncbi:hypothetical protein GRF59_25275 [Paenibacillus sp. HJL G12]|uniref:Uncharacterized protein n=1 Tax=Paenibacillus dendrobii TaxID=2691084 RepID=A0A7X3LJ75_9BACL|nr:hypothetical protein [Paenibacillus dendrobii]MWV46927.1 hypothetical protein [Paenibacillus dendrobii]